MAERSNFIVRGGLDVSNITKGLAKTQNQLGNFQKSISKSMSLVKTALGTLTLGALIKSSVKVAMTVESSMNQINRTMGNSANDFNKWVQSQSKSYGMARSEAYQYGATYSNLISGFTKDTEETTKYTEQLLKSSAVVASATGRTMQDTMERIRSGLLGNTESIEDLGINVNVAMIQSTEAFKKFANGKSWQQLDYQTQQQIRLMAILEQANIKYGDSLAGTTATRQLAFVATLKNIQLNLGQAFLPIYNVILPALTAFASKIEAITANFAAFSQALFGKSIQTTVASTTSGIENQSNAVTDLGDATEKAGKQANKALAPFDELNQTQSSSASSGTNTDNANTGNSSGGGVTTTPVETTVDSSVIKAIDNLKKAIKPTIDALGRLKEALEPVKNFVADGLKSFYEDVLVPIGKWVLGTGLPALLDNLSELISAIDWSGLTESIKKFNKAIAPLAIAVGEGFIAFVDELTDILTPVIAATVDLFSKALKGLATVINMIPKDVAIALGGALGGLAAGILAYKAATGVADIIKGIAKAFSTAFDTLEAHPILAIAGAIAALAGAALALDRAKFNNSELGKYVNKLDSLVKSSKEFNGEVDDMLDNHEERNNDIEAEYGAISILSDKYFDLADKTKKTNKEQVLMKSYAQELIDKIPELSGLIDGQTGAYKGTKEQIQELINKTKEYYLVQAAQEELIEIAKKQYEAEKNLKVLQDERVTLLSTIKQKQDEYNTALQTGSNRSGIMTQEEKNRAMATTTLSGEITNLKGKLGDLDIQISATKTSQNDLNTSWDYATDYISTYSGSAETDLKKVKTAVENTSSTINDSNMPAEVKQLIAEANKKFSENTSTKTAVNTWLGKISDTISSFKLPTLSVRISADTSGLGSLGKYPVATYATGGLPDTGQLFIANEAGPEMVGTIGGQTAVANSNQIVEGIKAGVYDAVMAAMSNQKTSVNVTLEGEAKGLFKAVKLQNDEYTKRTGKSAFAY